ncbi:trans-aconitate 2-methyltransferase [Emticicia sp. 21SJ11W-3]|uniref:class I SAM-dependent methyltransferase n=1 Tax=Emticicia sp. 21SJ11W-3 TaxID=2916755 RepID=UPI00209E8110|nr:class I SAM-dependent methyltransferase [Emticicia sp. 21SJ11W-3]UTA68334.1 class I SAM-dependent methyltransferase [Emticicia sp. 21SJ11W-3]
MSQTSQTRAEMPQGANKVLDRRTVENSYSSLIPLLQEGLSVLDVGCGSGSITAGVARQVGPNGKVVGIDFSEHLINMATKNYAHLNNLSFEVSDINTYNPDHKFDLVIAARTLQWVSNPAEVVSNMVNLLKPGGRISILDYNHTRIEWTPQPPQSMLDFYEAFLNWRADAGYDNAIADNLPAIYKDLGLDSVTIVEQHEMSRVGEESFKGDAQIWSVVAETRGNQVVKDGFISEEVRLKAIQDYNTWIADKAQAMKLYLLAIEAVKP